MINRLCPGCMRPVTTEVCPHCGWVLGQNNLPHQLPVDTVLQGKYRIGRVLGQGGFGITYIAWDMNLDIHVCIKEFYPSSTVNRDTTHNTRVSCNTITMEGYYSACLDRFLREGKALAKFRNVPQIVGIHDFFQANNTAYMVMEYVNGIDLAKYVQKRGGRLHMDEILKILKPVMEALQLVHEAGIIHRDISPDNIMLEPREGAKLLDFGAVRNVEHPDAEKELTRATESILKNGFAPMEQYVAKGSLGPWTDVYAMSATIYYCLTGRIPEDSPIRLMEGTELDWSGAQGLTEEKKAVLEKGMEPKAKERIASIRELMDQLYAPEAAPAAQAAPAMPITQSIAAQPVMQSVSQAQPEMPVRPSVLRPEPVRQEMSVSKKEEARTPAASSRTRSKVWLIPVFAAVLAAVVLVVLLLLPRGWRQEDGNYRYYSALKPLTSSWFQDKNDCWYYFGEDGYMQTGFQKIGDVRYYFGADGVMRTGFVKDGKTWYYMGTDGVMRTGFVQIDGKWFCFGSDGSMYTDFATIDGERYYFGHDGVMRTGFQTINGKRYYFGNDGVMRTGFQTINRKQYYFGTSGIMRTGFAKISGKQYYFGNDGAMCTGFQKINGKRYYFGTDGVMRTGLVQIGTNWYYFGDDGIMRIGTSCWINGYACYFDSNGIMTRGWVSGRYYQR